MSDFYMELKLFKEDETSIQIDCGVLGECTLFIKDENDRIEVEKNLSNEDIDSLIKMLQLAKKHWSDNG